MRITGGERFLRTCAVMGTLLVLAIGSPASSGAATADDATEFLVVDCLLPGQVRKLGTRMTYVTARQAIRTSAVDCSIRGGEYVAYDRADYRTALKVWLPRAQEGDLEAMANVGEIYEKGLGLEPDYEVAAFWYGKAAAEGYTRAQINLGYLYELGLGVEHDPKKALEWYRKASGMETAIDLDPSSVAVSAGSPEDAQLVKKLESELAALQGESSKLRQELDRAQQVLAESSNQQQQPPPQVRVEVKEDPRTRQELLTVQSTLAQREQEVSELDALLSQTRQQLAQTQQSLSRQQQELNQQQGKIAATKSEVSGKEAELTQLERELKEKEAAMMVALQQKQQESEKQAAELAERESQLQALEAELLQRRQQVTSSSGRIEELQARVAELEATRARQGVAKTTQLAVAEGLMAGPQVTMIDPVLPLARGDGPLVLRSAVPERQVVGRITAPAGVLSLTVNDMATQTNPQGVFTSKVTLAGSRSPVSIVAIDNQGKRSAISFSFEYSGAGALGAIEKTVPKALSPDYSDIKFGSYHALIIGNNDYRSLTDLKTAINDAEDLAEVLERRYNVKTTLLLDADRYQILSALNDLREKLTSDDNLLIYYAGHGVLDEVNMRGHWLPVDAEADNNANWISNVSITDMLNVIPAKQILVISDSCYSGSLTRSATARLESGKTQQERLNWLRTMSTKRARMVMSSGGLEPVMDGGGGDNSVFSRALLEVLESNQDVIEGQRLFNEVAAKVAFSASQVGFDQLPEYAPIRFAGHESGEFFLVPRS